MVNRIDTPHIKDAVAFDLRLQPCEKYTLDNGVNVHALHAGAQDVIMLEIVFYAGNWFEQKKLVASATNYLLKNGTSKKSAFDINEAFEYYGAHLTRQSYNETATITLHTLTKHLPELLPILEEMLSDATFPQSELEVFKQNMQQKLSVNLKKSDFVANRLIDAYVFGEQHPYGVYSSFEAYAALERQDLTDYYEQYYRRGNCVVLAAGRLPADLYALLNRHLGQLPLKAAKTDGLPVIPYTPASEKKYRVQNDADGVQGAIRMARPFPTRHHPDTPKMMVLNNIFGGFFGSRLMSNIREEKGYTYGIYSYIQNHIHDTAFMISTEAGRDVCEATITEICKEMKLLREDLVDEEELMLVRNYMMGSILADLDGPFQVIGRWKNLVLNNLDDGYFYRSLDIIRHITAEEIRELAQKYLVPEDFYELVVI
jgi:zinc protease